MHRATSALLLALLVLLALPSVALAHTSLVASTPQDGASLATSPATVTLTFSQPVELFDDTVVLRGNGTAVRATTVRAAGGTEVVATPAEPLAAGDWVVDWRILSQDSHVVDGEVAFRVEAASPRPSAEPTPSAPAGGGAGSTGGVGAGTDSPATARPEAAAPAEPAPRPSPEATAPAEPAPRPAPVVASAGGAGALEVVAGVLRVVFYLALMTAVGLALFTAGPHRGEAAGASTLARTASWSAAVALVAAVLEVAAHVGVVGGGGVQGILDAAVWRATARTGLGPALLLRVVGLALLAWAARRRARAVWVAGPDRWQLLGATLAVASLQFVGHTASATPAAVVRTADAAHAVAAAVWVGGLVGLAVLARHPDAAARDRTVGRFARWAAAAVVGVAVAGAALAVTHLPSIDATWRTGYGQLLLGKLVVVGVLALLGARNHFRVVPRVAAGDQHAVATLRTTVRVEVLLAAAVLVLTAVLVGTSPT